MKIIFLGIIAFLTGCAATSYKHPPLPVDGDSKVNFSIDSPELLEEKKLFAFRNYTNWVEIDFYHGDNGCPWDEAREAKESYLFTVKIDRDEPTKSFELPLKENNKIIYASINDSNGMTICPQNIRFQLKEDQEYFLTVKGHLNPSSRCKASLKTKSLNGNVTNESIAWSGPTNMFMGLYSYEAICRK